MEKGYAGNGTRMGIFLIGTVLVAISLMSVVGDLGKAQTPPAPEALVEAPPPAAIRPVADVAVPAPAAPVAAAEPAPAAPAAAPAPAPAPLPAAGAAGESAQRELKNLVQSWRNAWASRETAAYLAFYAAEFQGNADSPEQWRANRKRIIGQAKSIDIQIGEPDIRLEGADLATISFPLDYASDRFTDHGTKTLAVRRKNGQWFIEGEDFSAR